MQSPALRGGCPGCAVLKEHNGRSRIQNTTAVVVRGRLSLLCVVVSFHASAQAVVSAAQGQFPTPLWRSLSCGQCGQERTVLDRQSASPSIFASACLSCSNTCVCEARGQRAKQWVMWLVLRSHGLCPVRVRMVPCMSVVAHTFGCMCVCLGACVWFMPTPSKVGSTELQTGGHACLCAHDLTGCKCPFNQQQALLVEPVATVRLPACWPCCYHGCRCGVSCARPL